MLKHMVSPLVLAVALTGAAWAATDSYGTSNSSSSSTSSTMGTRNELTANQLLDMKVKGANGENIGDVENIVFDSNGRVSGVVVSVGGFLGIGEKRVSLPWSQFQISADDKNLTTNATKQDLQQAAAWQDSTEQTASRPSNAPPSTAPAPSTSRNPNR
jgi:sporulation protein YlmC with PRC-barrel domain